MHDIRYSYHLFFAVHLGSLFSCLILMSPASHLKNPALQDSYRIFNQDCELVSQLPNICINLNIDLFQHYSIYSTKVLREIQNAFFNKYSLSIDHTCYLIPGIEYIYTHNRVIHLPQILLYFLITVIKIMCFTITAVRCNSINRIAYCNNSCT